MTDDSKANRIEELGHGWSAKFLTNGEMVIRNLDGKVVHLERRSVERLREIIADAQAKS